MLSFASDADIPPVLTVDGPCSLDADGEDGGEGALGFQDENPAGFGRTAGPGGGGAAVVDDFSNAAILSRRDPGFGFGGGGED